MATEIIPQNYIADKLKDFKLADIRTNYKEIIKDAVKQKLGYEEFLINLIKAEEIGRNKRRVERNIHFANFESIKTMETLDFNYNENIDCMKIKQLSSLEFIDKAENILIIGPPGVGKTHIASAIGLKACEANKKVLFTNALELINKLSDAVKSYTLEESLTKLDKVDLLIIDELGYINMDKEKESIFFQLIRHRYEKCSLIITTNLPLNRWNEIFTGQIAATAILDRILHHCHTLSIPGNSYRVKKENSEGVKKNE